MYHCRCLLISQKDAIVEIKAKVPVAIHPTYSESQMKTAQGAGRDLRGELGGSNMSTTKIERHVRAAPWNRKSPLW